jgi:hypothetical protein
MCECGKRSRGFNREWIASGLNEEGNENYSEQTRFLIGSHFPSMNFYT